MNIKHILGAIVIILLIGNIFFIYELQFQNQSDNAMIGDKSFELPDNYSFNKLEISNGVSTISFFKSSNSTIDSAISNYKDAYSDNFTISVSDFNTKFPSKKTVATSSNNESIIKYWFEIDNNLYHMQLFNNDPNSFDSVARDIINSIH